MKAKGRISVDEAAARAYVASETVRDWIKGGRLEAISYGHRWWVLEASLADITEALRS